MNQRKQSNLTFRVTPKLREQLASRAAADGISLSEEVTRMLGIVLRGEEITSAILWVLK